MNDLYRRICKPSFPHRDPSMGCGCGMSCFVPATIDYEAAIRQLVFDIIMHERHLDESDMSDQAEATEQTDEWMVLFDAAVGEVDDE